MNKVLILCPTLSLTGGITKYNIDLINTTVDNERIEKIDIIVFKDKDEVSSLKNDKINFILCSNSKYLFLKELLKKRSQKYNFILCLHYSFLLPTILSNIFFNKVRNEIILFIYGIEVFKTHTKKIYDKINKILIDDKLKIVSITNYTLIKFKSNLNINFKNTYILNNAIDFKKYENYEPNGKYTNDPRFKGKKIITCLSRLDEKYKGIFTLIKAMKIVISKDINYCLLVGGHGKLIRFYNRCVKRFGLEKNVFFLGKLSEEDVNELYHTGILFALPSRFEGFGYVFIESIASGVNCIHGNSDGSCEALLDGKYGYSYDTYDKTGIANKILITKVRDNIDSSELKNYYSISKFKNVFWQIIHSKPRKKIVIVNSHPVNYHIQIYRNIAKFNNFHTEVFFLLNPFKKKPLEEQWPMKFVDEMEYLLSGYDYKFIKNLSLKKENTLFGCLNFPIIYQLIKNKPDFILLFGWNNLIPIFIIFSQIFFKTKLIIRGESDNIGIKKGLKSYLKKIYLTKLFKLFDIITYSYIKNKEFFMERGVSQNKLISFPCSVDNERYNTINLSLPNKETLLKEYNLKEFDRVFLFCGRLDDRKRIIQLINVFIKIDNIKIALVIIGDGSQKDEVLQKIHNKKNILYFGFKSLLDTTKFYKLSDFLVLNSKKDPSPKTVNEAMNFKTIPLISSNCGTANDMIIDNYNGFTFKTLNEDELVLKIKKLSNLKSDEIKKIHNNISNTLEIWNVDNGINNLKKELDNFEY